MQFSRLFPFGFVSDPQGLRRCVFVTLLSRPTTTTLGVQPRERLSRVPPRLEQEKETAREVT